MKRVSAILSAVSLLGQVSASYDPVLAKHMILYSAATFCKESTLVNWQCGAACEAEPDIVSFSAVEDP